MNKNKLTLKGLLLSCSRAKLALAVTLGILSGVLYALIIPTVLAGLSEGRSFIFGDGMKEHLTTLFFVLISCVLVTKASSVILINNMGKTAVARLRVELTRKINAMEVTQVEKIGLPKLMNILTEDMARVTGASLAIPMVLVAGVTAMGMLTYLAVLDLKIFGYTIAAIVFGLFAYQFPMNHSKAAYFKARNLRDAMQEGFRGLIFGAYELKLNKDKSERFLDSEIKAPIDKALEHEKRGDFTLHAAGNASEMLCFLAIGLIVFVLPVSGDFQHENLYGVVMALLYITGPIAQILNLMSQLKIGEISLERINSLYNMEVSSRADEGQINKDWNKLVLKDIEYAYASNDNSFSIGKIDLSLDRGKTYFIVGGNGSGKSTLSKVISMHYLADRGEIRFDDEKVTADNLVSARNRLFVIYSNYYLFNTIYKDLSEADLSLIEHYLKLFKLDDKTKLEGNTFTTVKLSDGQRRRLALIAALVEDRDIYILDEWAADQDPQFKELYYDKVLPELKRRGKTVIAITHDDRYFAYCDEVIKMENGQVVDHIKHNQASIAYSA